MANECVDEMNEASATTTAVQCKKSMRWVSFRANDNATAQAMPCVRVRGEQRVKSKQKTQDVGE